MIGLLFIVFPVAEIMVFMKVGDTYGYFNAVMALIVSFIVGLMVVQSQGRALLIRAQMELARGQLPANAVLQSALVFVGGLLLMIPGFLSGGLGLLCIVPGPRQLIGVWARRAFKRQLAKGRIRFFGSSAGAGFGARSNFERDVTPQIIDVKPLPSDDNERR